MKRELHEANRIAWNLATKAHNSHKRDQAAFFRQGGDTLFPEEVDLLGDVRGLSLVHLQCNAGQDSLSLARRGAMVTGVDISDTAIEFARDLSRDSGIPATFVRADVYDWLAETAAGGARFDVVFSSYGALVWLSNLELWAQGVAAILKPGGRLVVVEFHPLAAVFGDGWRPTYDYFTGGQVQTWEEGIGDYVADAGEALAPMGFEAGVQAFRNPHPSHEFVWRVADILTALLHAGLRLSRIEEYSYSNGAKLFPAMRELPGRRMIPPEGVPSLPLMLGLVATLP
jgi:SAM-dependent methyltransferase